MSRDPIALSKFLSFVLRHKPEAIGLVLGDNGWVEIADLVTKATAGGEVFTAEDVLTCAANNDKKRFTISDDGLRVRAAQGHSVEVDLALTPTTPPDILFHGTATRFVDAIRAEGLKPQSRQQVHLSRDEATALKVGQRHGKPHIFQVEAGRMQADGYHFYVADNGVWLTDAVPSGYLIDFVSLQDTVHG